MKDRQRSSRLRHALFLMAALAVLGFAFANHAGLAEAAPAANLPAAPTRPAGPLPAAASGIAVQLRAAAAGAWRRLGPAPRASGAAAATRVPILMYHYVGALPANADKIRRRLTVSMEAFDAQLDWLAAHGYEAVTLEQVADAWWGDGALPPQPVVLTLDDGYAETAALVAPRLAVRGWPGVFNVITGFVGYGDYVTWDQLRALRDIGMSIESHTVSHWDLTRLADSTLNKELRDARRDLQVQLGVAADELCYPSGRYDARVRAAAEAAGYRIATTTRWGIASATMDPLALPRIRVWGGETLAQFAAALPN